MMSAGMHPVVFDGMRQLFHYGGDVFVRLLRMVIVPLVFSSVFMAVVNLGNVRKLGTIGWHTGDRPGSRSVPDHRKCVG